MVAVSGGLDSMVLLHTLVELASRNQWRLMVAHFNHRLRGRASAGDESLVRRTAKSLGLQFVIGESDVRRFALRRKVSIEMAARKLRHDFFASTSSRLGVRTVALAHHADDQVELFFLRLLRGSGGEGLSGMDWMDGSPADPAVVLVRPMLNLYKEDLRAFARQRGIEFREDLTNAHLEHRRNWIRHELLPLLRAQYQPALARVVLRAMEIIRLESDFVSEVAQAWQPRRGRGRFERLHVAVQRRRLQLELIKLGVPPEFELIERLRLSVGEVVTLNPQLAVWRDEKGTVRTRLERGFEFDAKEAILDLEEKTGSVAFENLRLQWRIQSCSGFVRAAMKKPAQCELFDAQKVGSPVVLRHWRPGDRFQPIGLGKTVKVQDLFTNAKIPRDKRHQLVVGVTARGQIFWIEGLRISELFKLDRKTSSVLKWNWERR